MSIADSNHDLKQAIMRVYEKSFAKNHRRTKTTLETETKPSQSRLPASQLVLQRLTGDPLAVHSRSSNRSTVLDRTSDQLSENTHSKVNQNPIVRTMIHRNKVPDESQKRIFLGTELQNVQLLKSAQRPSHPLIMVDRTPAHNSAKQETGRGFSRLSEKRKAADSLRNNSAVRVSAPERPKESDSKGFSIFPIVEFYEKNCIKTNLNFYEKVIKRLTTKVQSLKQENSKLKAQNSSLLSLQQRLVDEKVRSRNEEQQARSDELLSEADGPAVVRQEGDHADPRLDS